MIVFQLPKIWTSYAWFFNFQNAGAIIDSLAGEKELAHYFLTILNLSDEYKKWEKLSHHKSGIPSVDHNVKCSSGLGIGMKRKRQYPTDHTQVWTVSMVIFKLFIITSELLILFSELMHKDTSCFQNIPSWCCQIILQKEKMTKKTRRMGILKLLRAIKEDLRKKLDEKEHMGLVSRSCP